MTDDDIRGPHCHALHNAHTGAKGTRPTDGDTSICWECRQPSIFTMSPLGELGLRMPTPEELAWLMAAPSIRAVLAASTEAYTPAQAGTLAFTDTTTTIH